MAGRKIGTKEINSFKRNLIKFRESLGFSKNGFAIYLGLDRNTIQKIEIGSRAPGYKVLKALNDKHPEINLLEWFGFKVVK